MRSVPVGTSRREETSTHVDNLLEGIRFTLDRGYDTFTFHRGIFSTIERNFRTLYQRVKARARTELGVSVKVAEKGRDWEIWSLKRPAR